MKLYNSLTKQIEQFTPLKDDGVRIYSCGPTVYDHAHIGNLSAFIAADTLRRVLSVTYPGTRQVMNLTDIDDKTIKKSREQHSDLEPKAALHETTTYYTELFFDDMRAVGNDVDAIEFIRATSEQTMQDIQSLIVELYTNGFAYIADDGVYFSIDAYKKSGKTYGQLVDLTSSNTSEERIKNDEYDKESLHDFALWKTAKESEPAWEFELDGHNMTGRPGWHIECSAMSTRGLGQPFDIHTGGIDLKFPHHENEIAQSTACRENPVYATTFVHNDHVLVDGQKMAKSAGNFYTLADDIQEKHVDALAFRLLVLQSHYRSPTNFSFDTLQAASNRLNNWRTIAVLRHQTHDTLRDDEDKSADQTSAVLRTASQALLEALQDDIDTPRALAIIDEAFHKLEHAPLSSIHRQALVQFLEKIDELLGLRLLDTTPDIDDSSKELIVSRLRAREEKDWNASDALREKLQRQNIGVRDTSHGSIWYYEKH